MCVDRMKIVIAMDSFKGSLTSMEAGTAAAEGILRVFPACETVVLPAADGGEGTTQVFLRAKGCARAEVQVRGPLGEPSIAVYGILPGGTAVMEIAQAAGLEMVPPEKRDPLETGTFGVGQMIRDALDRGCREIILGLGGSATNDGGLGMLTALGGRFYDALGTEVGVTGRDLLSVDAADLSGLDPRLRECVVRAACDVDNPLCGPRGASAVYGPQKGADPETVAALDQALARYSQILTSAGCPDIAAEKGAGAAGGLGYAVRLLPRSSLEPGAALLLDAAGLKEHLAGADLLITGEGKLDAQTAMGKCPSVAASFGKEAGVPVIALAGSVDSGFRSGEGTDIDAAFSVVQGPCTYPEAMERENARENIRRTAEQVFRLIRGLRR